MVVVGKTGVMEGDSLFVVLTVRVAQ